MKIPEIQELNTSLENLGNEAIENLNDVQPLERPAEGVEGQTVKLAPSQQITFGCSICGHSCTCPGGADIFE